ncbi:unnamed protein product [Symbiodinium sp. CCMP2456]|nr:unnamed protein product [Symbiodinium sp. CCMP2456]
MGRQVGHQRLACALIFMLCVREVAAARDAFQVQQMAAYVGSTLRAGDAHTEWRSAVAEAGEFSIKTMWSLGEADSLRWAEANITFRFAGGSHPTHVEVAGLDTVYRIMPDAVVGNQEIDGMAVMAIAGWQAYDISAGKWGASEYSKKRALFFRTEMNPSVGLTKKTWLGLGHIAGLRVYQRAKTKETGDETMYYINEHGKMKSIDVDDVTQHPAEHEQLGLYMSGSEKGVFKRPDKELMAMVDGMLGETSCLGKASKCAFRCFYDSEKDVCGPVAFCEKTRADSAEDVLAPFGGQQKCRAVGGDTHEEADRVLAVEGLGKLKEMAINVTERLSESEAVSWSSSGRSSLKASVALWLEAADLLNVLETLPLRLGENSGGFKLAARRAADTDLKHWRRRPDPLTIDEYEAAAKASLSFVAASRGYSVAAKLHSELVSFVVKRPSLLMHYTKSESDDKCILSDKTASDRAQVTTFVNYFMKVPGYNADDLQSVRLDLPEHCQDFLAGMDKLDVERNAQDASEGEKLLSPGASFGELRSERLSSAIRPFSVEAGSSAFQSSAEHFDFAGTEAEAQQKFVIIASIIVGLVCLVVAGTFAIAGLANWNRCLSKTNSPGGEHCLAALVCTALGLLVICGAFAMSLVVGVAVLAGTLFLLHAVRHYFLQTGQREIQKPVLAHRGHAASLTGMRP